MSSSELLSTFPFFVARAWQQSWPLPTLVKAAGSGVTNK